MPVDVHPDQAAAWPAVRSLVDRAPSLPDLRAHGLQLIAARTWREQGREVPDELIRQELFAAWQVHVAEEILRTVSEVVDQDVLVLKGIAVAAHYPDRALRPFGDLDLFVADPVRAQGQLLAAGFRCVAGFAEGFFEDHHHLEPLELPGRETVKVEIHSRAPWVHWCPSPSFSELRRRARPGADPRIWFPDPADHAIVLASHSWHSLPLRRALDLVDIALVSDGIDREALAELAERRHVRRLWDTTLAAGDALMFGRGDPLPLRTWARDLPAVRECSVLERHLRTWFAPFWVRTPRRAAGEALRAVALDLSPFTGETWPEKLDRIRQGVRHPLRPIGDHDRALGPAARRLGPRHGRASGPSEEPSHEGGPRPSRSRSPRGRGSG